MVHPLVATYPTSSPVNVSPSCLALSREGSGLAAGLEWAVLFLLSLCTSSEDRIGSQELLQEVNREILPFYF